MKKLNLEKFKVKSFITKITEENVNTVKGGDPVTDATLCVGEQCSIPSWNPCYTAKLCDEYPSVIGCPSQAQICVG